MKRLIYPAIVLLVLSFTFADIDLGYPCETTNDCAYYLNNQPGYCDSTCFLSDEPLPPQNNVPDTPVIAEELLREQIEQQIALLNLTSPINESELAELRFTLQFLQGQSASTEERLTAIENGYLTLEEGYTGTQEQLTKIQTTINDINTQLQYLSDDQNKAKQHLNSKVEGVATGLAGLQTKVATASSDLSEVQDDLKTEKSFTTFLTYSFIIILALAIFGAIYIYVNRNRSESPDINQQIVEYITKHIKTGKKFPQIKENLLKAGWSEHDITWAYKETLKQNYKAYLQRNSSVDSSKTQNPKSSQINASVQENTSTSESGLTDKRKAMMIGIVSVLVLLGILLLLRGVTTGQAIYFQTPEQFAAAVHDKIEKSVAKSEFKEKVDYLTLCVQVTEKNNAASYLITKTPFGQTIASAAIPCDQEFKYDLGVKFTSLKAFEYLSDDLSCAAARKIHGESNNGGAYVLPSRLILPGFKVNPTASYEPYCTLMKECLTATEITLAGVNC